MCFSTGADQGELRQMHQGNRLLSRTILKNFVRILPAAVLLAVMIDIVACNSPGFLTAAGSSAAATSTSTPGTGALAFVSNFAAGNVASFTRNTTTGVLKRTGTISAGQKNGPKGMVVGSGGSFLYVANKADDNIYEYAVSQSNGALTPLSPASVSNGTKSGPDEIAINPAGTFLFVTGFSKGTVTTYSVNTSTGQLTQVSKKVTGLTNPFGIAVDSTGSFVFVAEKGAGLVDSYKINSTTGVLSTISSVSDLGGGGGGAPGFFALDPNGKYIYVTDLNAGVIAVLQVNAGALTFGQVVPTTTSSRAPMGIAYSSVSTVANFLFTANQGSSTMWSFQIQNPGFPISPVEFGLSGEVNSPTAVVVDPQNAFLYTTNQAAGTVSQFSLSPSCFNSPGAPCFVGSVATQSGGSSGGPFGIVLAN
jgi:6-phosphogluconolactonase (cycloisomerase 2 family)